MSYKVVYFTRTGTSKRVAEKIAEKLSVATVEIVDNKIWGGPMGFMRGAYYAAKNKEVSIKVEGKISDEDEIIMVSPIWVGNLVPALSTFLRKCDKSTIHLVTTSKDSGIKDKAGFKSLTEIITKKNNEDEVINALVAQLKK